MKKMAVLFTDVVGSTNFFKVHGDLRGREMLRTHHYIALSIIEEYGGSLIKEVGDSVMAYFPDPQEALKAAISMQRGFTLHNKEGNVLDEIHVRIGLHYGKVIIEEKDIYGDVVNVAAKLTNIAKGDQIFISHEIYDITKEIPSVNYELINAWTIKNVPADLTVYRVVWEKAPAMPPLKKALLLVFPDANNPHIDEVLDRIQLIGQGKDFLFGARETLSDNTTWEGLPILVYDNAKAALEGSRQIFSYLTASIAADNGSAPPFKTLIADASLPKRSGLASGTPYPEPAGIFRYGLYLTEGAYREICDDFSITGCIPVQAEPYGALYVIDFQEQGVESSKESETHLHTPPVVHDRFPPCFYCNSKKHPARYCPSKDLTEMGRSINRIGYMSLKQIEEFSSAIESPSAEIDDTAYFSLSLTPFRASELTAHAYYDIKMLYQFRFSNVLWNTGATVWSKVTTDPRDNQGGFAWLAQDSLRVSNYEKARSFLSLALEKSPDDYKAYCVSGFLEIEHGNLEKAVEIFCEAFKKTKTKPQKIYISMILSRLYDLLGDQKKARDMIQRVLLIDEGCNDAIYQDILFQLKQKNDKPALQRLAGLVQENKEFFVVAMIDPELSPYRNNIYAHLGGILSEAQKNATRHYNEAKIEFANARSLLPPTTLADIGPILTVLDELMKSESYFAYLDVPHYCNNIKIQCRNILRDQKLLIKNQVKSIRSRLQNAHAFITSYRYAHLADKYKNALMNIGVAVDRLGDVRSADTSDDLQSCHDECVALSSHLSRIERKFETLDIFQQIVRFCLIFLKKSSIFFSIVFFLGIFIFPFFTNHINLLFVRLDVGAFPSAWESQRSFLIVGGIASIIGAACLTIKDFFNKSSTLLR